jgi:hypothetical protein
MTSNFVLMIASGFTAIVVINLEQHAVQKFKTDS